MPFLLFGLIAFAFFADPFLNNRAFLPTDFAYGGASTGYVGLREAMPAMPVWNTHVGGFPVSSNILEYTRDITWSLLSVILPVDHKQVAAYQMLLLLAAGGFFYMYVRLLGVGRLAATVLAVNYQLSPMLLSLNYAFHQSKMGVIVLLPLLFYGAERIARYGRLRDGLILAAAMVGIIYTGHLQMAYFAFIGVGCYVLFRAGLLWREGEDRGRWVRKGLLCAAMMVLAMLIGARGVLPQYSHATTESKRVTDVAAQPAEQAAADDFAVSWSLHPEEIGSLLVPEFGGFNHTYWGRNAFKINVEYFGLLPVALALAGLIGLYRHSYILFFAALGLFGIGFGLGAHLFVHGLVAAILPGIKSLRAPGMMVILTAFSASVIAALTLQTLCDKSGSRKKQDPAPRRILFGLAGLLLMMIIGIVATRPVLSAWMTLFDYTPAGGKFQAFEANVVLLTRGCLYAALWLAAALTLVWAWRAGKIKPALLLTGLLVVSVVDNWRISRQFLVMTPPDYHQSTEPPRVAAYEWIKQNDSGHFRVLANYQISAKFTYPGINRVLGFHDFTMQRYHELMKNLGNMAILDVANVKYIVTDQQLAISDLVEVHQAAPLRVYRNDRAYPFYYCAGSVVVIDDHDQILNALQNRQIRLENTVILEEPPDPAFGLTIGPGEESGSVTVIEFDIDAGRYRFRVETKTPGVLVVSDNFHPDWRATVNGEPAPVFRANYFWKGVPVPAGESTVSLEFQTPTLTLSQTLSRFGLILFFALCVVEGVRAFRKRTAGSIV